MSLDTLDDDQLGALIRAADPLHDTELVAPDVRDEVRAALARNAQRVSTGVPGLDLDTRRSGSRRRLLVAAVVAGGVAAAVTVPLVLPGGSPGAPTSASARALHTLADGVRSYSGPTPTTTTTIDDGIAWVDTRTGRAFFRQRVVISDVVGPRGTTSTSTWDPPRFLTTADARRAQHVTGPPIPTGTQVHTDTCAADPLCGPTAAQLAALPTTAAGLEHSIARHDLGGCEGGPGCRWADIVSYVLTPGVTTGTRAAAFDLLASAPGVTVLGHRTVDGRRGLAVRSVYGNEGRNLVEVDVFDVRDGSLLAQDQYLTAAYDAAEGPLPVPLGTLISSERRAG